jgi:hypothetical protein
MSEIAWGRIHYLAVMEFVGPGAMRVGKLFELLERDRIVGLFDGIRKGGHCPYFNATPPPH